MSAAERASRYEIRVQGALDARWSAWFAGLEVACNPFGKTTLTGPLRDQAALHGVLARIRDLGLPLIAVRRLDTDPACRATVTVPSSEGQDRQPEAPGPTQTWR